MTLLSTKQGAPLAHPETVPTPEVDAGTIDNALLVQGAFGLTGLYPLVGDGPWAELYCNMYFVRIAASDAARERNAVVTEKTDYTLRYRGETYANEAMCGVCANRQCPANRNSEASEGEWPAGRLILAR